MKISKRFNLGKSQYELDFVDIDPDVDLPLFIDPYYLGKCKTPWAEDVNRTIYSFFSLLLTLIRSGQLEKAHSHFSHLNEPNETCLGLSRRKPAGRGVGPGDTHNIFTGILKSKAVRTGLVKDLEDFRIFVDGIDRDKTSDMTTNIIRKHLIEYTQQQCRLWLIPLQASVPSGFIWNRDSNSWENTYTDMLVINRRRILLVPKRIVSFSHEYTSQRYCQHFVLNYLQEDHLRRNSSLVQFKYNKRGQIARRFVTKKSLRQHLGHITKDYLADFTARYPEVFKHFRTRTEKMLRRVTDNDLTEEVLQIVIQCLIKTLSTIPPGGEQATFYHRTVVGVLELLFYPRLTSPQVEKEIHDGRKRIDITFDNSAESGFFYRLPTTYDIPSRFIFVECKNYSRDVKNPELDQISGRFSPNRGKFGIVACRSIEDMKLFLDRCSDTYHDERGVVLPLVDSDLINMLDNYEDHGIDYCEAILVDRFRSVALT